MRVTALAVFALGGWASLHAQAVLGSGAVTGQIRDFANQGIPGTTVILTNAALDIRREMYTTDDGLFDSVELIPASGYDLKVTRKGFKDVEVKDVHVIAGRTVSFRITLQQDNSTRPVKIGPPQTEVDDTREGIYQNVLPPEVQSTPSAERSVDALAATAPGVTQSPVTGVLYPYAQPLSNSVMIDGIYTTRTHWLLQPRIEPDLPLDSTSELQVITAAPTAEFDHTAGASVNILTLLKPTDAAKAARVHGSLWDYYMDNNYNATPLFAPGFYPKGHQQQGGGNAGGSLLKNHLFWFSSFEAIRGSSQGLNLVDNPLLKNPAGTAILPSNCGASAAQCNAAVNYLGSQLNKVVNRSISSMDGLAKVDYHLTEDQVFSFEAGAMHRHSPDGSEAQTVATNGGLLGANGTYTDEWRFVKAAWSSQWGGKAHSMTRLYWTRDRFSDYSDSSLLPLTGTLGLTVAGSTFGANPNYPETVSQQNREVSEIVSISAGSHTIKLGVEYARGEDWQFQVFNRGGMYDYPSLTAFALDFSGNAALHKNYTAYTQTFGNALADLHTVQYIGFAEDTWKVLPRLTVNAGVHYERWQLPHPTLTSPSFFQTATIPAPDKDIGPRAGLSYLINNKTVARIGFGEYYQPYPGSLLDSLFMGNGIYQEGLSVTASQTGAGAPVYPRTIPFVNLPTGGQNVAYALASLRNPYTQQGSIGIERALTSTTSVSVSYIYTRGKALWSQLDFNLNPPTLTESYVIDNAAGVQTGTYTTPVWNSRGNPAFAHAYQVQNDGSSKYEGEVLQVTQRVFHGLSATVSYTRATATSNVNGPPLPQLGYAVPAATFVGDAGADGGPSTYWQRNRTVVNWTYAPRLNGRSRLVSGVVNGWEISGIGVFASGMPETPLVMMGTQQFSGVSMSYVNSLNGSGGWNTAPYLGINSLKTPSQRIVNARLSRSFTFRERYTAKLMLEGFNVFNMQNATGVNAVAYLAQGGVLKPAPGLGGPNAAGGFPFGDSARRLQAALKITF